MLSLDYLTLATRPPIESATTHYPSHRSIGRFDQSANFSIQAAYDEVVKVWKECKTANWDRYDALPVKAQTFRNTYFFINADIEGWPSAKQDRKAIALKLAADASRLILIPSPFKSLKSS